MGLFFYTKKGSIISTVDLPTTEIIEPENKGFVQYGQAFFLCFAPILPPISKFQFVLIIEVAQLCLFCQLINHWSDCVLSLLCNV